jgi:hypothetical protein
MVVSRMYRRRLVVEMSQKRLNGKMYLLSLEDFLFNSTIYQLSHESSQIQCQNNNKHGGKEVCFSGLEARI